MRILSSALAICLKGLASKVPALASKVEAFVSAIRFWPWLHHWQMYTTLPIYASNCYVNRRQANVVADWGWFDLLPVYQHHVTMHTAPSARLSHHKHDDGTGRRLTGINWPVVCSAIPSLFSVTKHIYPNSKMFRNITYAINVCITRSSLKTAEP